MAPLFRFAIRPLLTLVLAGMTACGGGQSRPQPADAAGESGTPAGGLVLLAPAEPAAGVAFPVIVRAADGAPLDGEATLVTSPGARQTFALRRGRGSASVRLTAEGPVRLDASFGDRRGQLLVTVRARPARRLAGALSGADLRWGPEQDILLGDASVPAGMTLSIEAGTRVLLEAAANLSVAGALEVRGSAAAPVLFAPAGERPWGGIALDPGARASLVQLLLTGGGADARRVFGHSASQPVVFADRAATLLVEGGGAVDNPGKAYSSRGATVTLTDLLISRCDQGGEHDDSTVTIERAHFLEMPDGKGRGADDDNDGIYLSSGVPGMIGTRPSVLRDTVIAAVDDDGVDHAGVPVLLERVWIEGAAHEGVAASNGSTMRVIDSVIRRCQQGIEAGWGNPEVTVEHTSILDTEVGLRWGDEYPAPMTSAGTLLARQVVVSGSRRAAVLARWEGGGVSSPSSITAACSAVGPTEWAGRDGNVSEPPPLGSDGCVLPGTPPLPGCPAPPGPRACKP